MMKWVLTFIRTIMKILYWAFHSLMQIQDLYWVTSSMSVLVSICLIAICYNTGFFNHQFPPKALGMLFFIITTACFTWLLKQYYPPIHEQLDHQFDSFNIKVKIIYRLFCISLFFCTLYFTS